MSYMLFCTLHLEIVSYQSIKYFVSLLTVQNTPLYGYAKCVQPVDGCEGCFQDFAVTQKKAVIGLTLMHVRVVCRIISRCRIAGYMSLSF